MIRALWLAFALSVAALAACSSGPCQNLAHAPCDIDAGSFCPTHQACIDASSSVDPCQNDAGSCCFQVCAQNSDCPSGQLCTEGACNQGRCL